MRDEDQPYALALLTRRQVEQLGPSLQQIWPIEEAPCFGGLLSAIDEADRAYWRQKEAEDGSGKA